MALRGALGRDPDGALERSIRCGRSIAYTGSGGTLPERPKLLADCIDHRTPIGTYALDDTLPASVHTSLDVRISCSSEVRAFEEAADRQQAPRRCLWLTSSLLAISPTRMPWRPARSPSRRASPRCNDAAPLTTDPDEQLRRQPAEARRLPNRRCPKRGPAARSHFGPA